MKRMEVKMILADKIINERKKNGWSQEELASKLSVSRQSVSKWEGAQAVPDLQKIIAMAEIFGVSTDYLLKDDMELATPMATAEISTVVSDGEPPLRKVSLEEASQYISDVKKGTPSFANAVTMCIYSPIVLLFMAGVVSMENAPFSEWVGITIGMLALFALIAVAVYIFIINGSKMKKYEYLDYEAIDTAYGVEGMARSAKEALSDKHTRFTAIGVIMCVLCAVPLIVSSLAECSELIIIGMLCLLLAIVGVAVNMFIRTGDIMEAYDRLLEIGDYTVNKKLNARKLERISSVFWCAATAIYLGISFYTNDWQHTWIVWPVAAVVYVVIKVVAKMILKVED